MVIVVITVVDGNVGLREGEGCVQGCSIASGLVIDRCGCQSMHGMLEVG